MKLGVPVVARIPAADSLLDVNVNTRVLRSRVVIVRRVRADFDWRDASQDDLAEVLQNACGDVRVESYVAGPHEELCHATPKKNDGLACHRRWGSLADDRLFEWSRATASPHAAPAH